MHQSNPHPWTTYGKFYTQHILIHSLNQMDTTKPGISKLVTYWIEADSLKWTSIRAQLWPLSYVSKVLELASQANKQHIFSALVLDYMWSNKSLPVFTKQKQ